jgi:hypothetical protein
MQEKLATDRNLPVWMTLALMWSYLPSPASMLDIGRTEKCVIRPRT